MQPRDDPQDRYDEMTDLVRAAKEEQILKVSNRTDVHKLAHSIVATEQEGKRVVISCIGVMTINQAVKAIAVANGKTAPRGYVFLTLPAFHTEIVDNDVESTVIRFTVIKHLIGT